MSSGFISENEINERRKIRQEQWEKVRKPDQPYKAPEEEYDRRTLFDRLEEQRMKKDLEYEETHKLKNMVKGLDDDEVDFLEMVDRTKMEEERKLYLEEQKEIRQFRDRVAALEAESVKKSVQPPVLVLSSSRGKKPDNSRFSQRKLLAGAIVKKRDTTDSSNKSGNQSSTSTSGTVQDNEITSDSPISKKLKIND